MLMIFAGSGLVSLAPLTLTVMPPAHNFAVMMSESSPPHLPSARTGRIGGPQVSPAMPTPLLVLAPRIPATRIPCQELGAAFSLLHSLGWLVMSVLVIQSPGSDAPGPGQAPPFATKASVMKQ